MKDWKQISTCWPAYGGSCFPKDTRALVSTGRMFKTNLSVVKSVINSNDKRSNLLLNKISKIMNNKIKNKNITFLVLLLNQALMT